MSDKTIQTKFDSLEDKIERLKQLKADCESIDVSAEAPAGSGESIMLIKEADEQYKKIKEKISELLENSAGFFENVKNSLKDADETAAGKMK